MLALNSFLGLFVPNGPPDYNRVALGEGLSKSERSPQLSLQLLMFSLLLAWRVIGLLIDLK